MRPPETGGPRSSGPSYPVIFSEQTQRAQTAVDGFNRLTQSAGIKAEVALQPITATIQSVPMNLITPLYLPKVGVDPEMNEEETRESLRRFITDWRALIGADPAQLSLIERIDRPDGVKVAKYEQRPFRFPLRGGYGVLEIQFLANRALRNLTSTCIPEADRLQSALAQVVPIIEAPDAINLVRTSDLVYRDANGQEITSRVAATDEVSAAELVTYVMPASGRTDALELHIAWEIGIGTSPRRLVYVDAVEGKLLQT